MQGLWGKTESELRGTIILLHGIRGYKEYFTDLTAQLNDSGYNTLALDLRAHGSSGGEYCTFGYHEKKDLKAAVDFLLSKPNADSTIGLWGQSLGGAIAYQALENDKRLKFGIIESTFSELKTIVHDYSERMFGFSISWVNKYALNRAGTMADFIPKDVSPFASAANVTQPMLVAHGTKDRNINFDYGKANFDNLNSENKTFLAIEGAGHNSLWQVGGEEYRQQVYQFLSSLR
jgi:alpha-beta hydrolase superfamily lysophospholipase